MISTSPSKIPPELGNYYRINATSSVVIPTDLDYGRPLSALHRQTDQRQRNARRIRAGGWSFTGDTITVDLMSSTRAASITTLPE